MLSVLGSLHWLFPWPEIHFPLGVYIINFPNSPSKSWLIHHLLANEATLTALFQMSTHPNPIGNPHITKNLT